MARRMQTSTQVANYFHARRKLDRQDYTSAQPVSSDSVSRLDRVPLHQRPGFGLLTPAGRGNEKKEADYRDRLRLALEQHKLDKLERLRAKLAASEVENETLEEVKPRLFRENETNDPPLRVESSAVIVNVVPDADLGSDANRLEKEQLVAAKMEYLDSTPYDLVPCVKKEPDALAEVSKLRYTKVEKGKRREEADLEDNDVQEEEPQPSSFPAVSLIAADNIISESSAPNFTVLPPSPASAPLACDFLQLETSAEDSSTTTSDSSKRRRKKRRSRSKKQKQKPIQVQIQPRMRAKRKTRRPQIDHEQAAVEGDPKEIERDDGIDSNQWNPFQLPTRSSSGSPQPFLFPVVYEWPVFKMPSSLEPPRVVKPFG